MKKMISVFLILILVPAVFAADICDDEFEAGDMSENWRDGEFETPDDFPDSDVDTDLISHSTTTKVDFSARTETICGPDTNPEAYNANGYFDWTAVADPDYSKVIYTNDGYVAVVGLDADDISILNVDFYMSDGSAVVAKYTADFNNPINFDIDAATSSGVDIVVVDTTGGNAYTYLLTTAGQQWNNAYSVGGTLLVPKVYSNSGSLGFSFMDSTNVYFMVFDESDGSEEDSIYLYITSAALQNLALYLDDSGNGYILSSYDDVSELKLIKASGSGKFYEETISTSSFVYPATRITECGDNLLCFAALFDDYSRLFQLEASSGEVQHQARFATNLVIRDVAASGIKVFGAGEDTDDSDGFAVAIKPSTEAIIWENEYADSLGSFSYYAISVGSSTVALSGYGFDRFYTTLVGKNSGSIVINKKVNIEGNDNMASSASVDLFNLNNFFVASYDMPPPSGFLGRLNGPFSSSCGVEYATYDDAITTRSNINTETPNDASDTWTKTENLVGTSSPSTSSLSDPACSGTDVFMNTAPELSVFLEKVLADYNENSDELVVTGNHMVFLNIELGGDGVFLNSYDYNTGAHDCGLSFDYGGDTPLGFKHKGDGSDTVVVAMTDNTGRITVSSVNADTCAINWITSYTTATFDPLEIGDIAFDNVNNRVEVWYGMDQATTYRFLDVQFNKNTGALNRGVVITPSTVGPTTTPEGILIHPSTGDAYALADTNGYAHMVKISGTSPGATVTVVKLASDDQNTEGNMDQPIYLCDGGSAVCALKEYSDSGWYSRVFVFDIATLSTTFEFLSVPDAELYGLFVDPAYDDIVYLYGGDYNNNGGILAVINANTGNILEDVTFDSMVSVDSVAATGDYSTGNLITVIGGNNYDSNPIVQQYNTNDNSIYGFDFDFTNNDWGLDVHTTSDPNEFIGYATDFSAETSMGFLFGPQQGPGPGGLVPEFSLPTLLLAVLLAGGLVLFVVRRKP